MGNPHKGEADLVAGDKSFTLKFSMNAIASVEDLLDKDITQITDMLNGRGQRVSLWRAMLWAGLRANHPGLTLADAGDIMEAATLAETMKQVGAALKAAFPQPVEGEAENPQKASPDGTGNA